MIITVVVTKQLSVQGRSCSCKKSLQAVKGFKKNPSKVLSKEAVILIKSLLISKFNSKILNKILSAEPLFLLETEGGQSKRQDS